MNLKELQKISLERCSLWHQGGVEEWSALEWAGAMCGEAGEAANFAKKLKRVESFMQNIDSKGRPQVNTFETEIALAKEVADTILYAVLLLARIGVTDPDILVAEVFNRKSEAYGFPQRIEE